VAGCMYVCMYVINVCAISVMFCFNVIGKIKAKHVFLCMPCVRQLYNDVVTIYATKTTAQIRLSYLNLGARQPQQYRSTIILLPYSLLLFSPA